jgi:hypothetical protein
MVKKKEQEDYLKGWVKEELDSMMKKIQTK